MTSENWDEIRKKMVEAGRKAAEEEVKKHHDAGRKVSVWRDGKIIFI